MSRPAEQVRAGSARYRKKHKGSLLHRVRQAISNQKWNGKRNGYQHCDYPPELIVAAYDGKCFLCGVPEIECTKKLHVEHDHVTGEFRGWACSRCNLLISSVENDWDLIHKFRSLHPSNENCTPIG